MKSGIAALEEYLQNLYIENYEKFEVSDLSKVELLQTLYPDYFYSPRANGIGSLNYIVNNNGKALYLIQKDNLPNEIKESLNGGNAGEKSYTDYLTMNDVYGVTKDLKVYYSSANNSNVMSISDIEFDSDDMSRVEFDVNYNKFGNLNKYDQNGDGVISALEVKSIQELVVDSTSPATDLSELYHFTALKRLILKDKNFKNLNGMEYCPYINYLLLNNCTVEDYSKIKYLTSIVTLNITDIDDEELLDLCTAMKQTDFNKLSDLAVSGYLFWDKNAVRIEYRDPQINDTSNDFYTTSKTVKTITTLYPLSLLSKNTQSAVLRLGINNMNLGNTEIEITDDDGNSNRNLTYIKDFANLNILRVEFNSLTSLIGLEKMQFLTNLYCRNNNLGLDEDGVEAKNNCMSSLLNKANLAYINAINNPNLKFVDYLKNDTKITSLFLAGCDRTMNVNNIANILKNCGTNYSLPCKFLNGTKYVWSDYFTRGVPNASQIENGYQQLTADNLTSDLLNNTSITILDLNACYTGVEATEITNDVLNTILKSMPQLQYVRLKNTNLSTLEFCGISNPSGDFEADLDDLNKKSFVPLIYELDIQNTYVTDLKNLNCIIKKTSDFPNGREIGTLRINSQNALDEDGKSTLNLTEIQDVLNGCKTGGAKVNTHSTGLCIGDWETLKLLEDCTRLEKISAYNGEFSCPNPDGLVLDLTKCMNLTSISQVYYNVVMKLPTSVTSYSSYVDKPPILCANVNYTLIKTGDYGKGTSTEWKNFWRSVFNAGTIDRLELLYCGGFNATILKDLIKEDALKNKLSSLGNNILHLKYTTANGEHEWTDLSTDGLQCLKGLNKLTFYRFKTVDTTFLENMSSIEDLTIEKCHLDTTEHLQYLYNLKFLNLGYNELLNLNGIKSLLTNIKNNNLENKLQRIIVNENYISDLSPIDGLETLQEFQIINNNLSVSSSIINRLNADILYDLYKDNSGSLRYLRIFGNNDFVSSISTHNLSSISGWNSDWLK